MTRLDITLITGFLGSGKTTLLQRQLEMPDFPRESTALVINDAGPVNIDARVLRGKAARIEALTGGCACCVTPRQLVQALLGFAASPGIERVWIEASGVADPEELLERLTDTDLLEKTILRKVIHVIDGVQLKGSWIPGLHHKDHVRWADVVVLTRADQLSDGEIRELTSKVRDWNPHAVILPASRGDCLLPAVESPASQGAYFLPKSGAHQSYRSVFVPIEQSVAREDLETQLRTLPETVVRAKGFVRFHDQPQAIHFIQYAAGTGRVESWRFGADDVPLGMVCIGRLLDETWATQHFRSDPRSP
jgi:G3E family GTPase